MGDEGSKDNLPQGAVVQTVNDTQPEIQKITVDDYTNAQIWDKEEEEIIKGNVSYGKPLIIQDGTQFGEYDAYYIKGMQSKNLTIGNVFDDEGNFLNMQDRLRYETLSEQLDKQKEFAKEALRLFQSFLRTSLNEKWKCDYGGKRYRNSSISKCKCKNLFRCIC